MYTSLYALKWASCVTKKLLDLRPDDVSSSLIDVAGFNPSAGLSVFDDIRDIYGTSVSGVPPEYHSETSQKCSPPSNDTWPGTGCICFEPNDQGGYQHVSLYDMVDAEGPGTSLTRFRTAFNTSVTGGLTVSGCFKAGDTSNEPHNANPGFPGQQTSLIFVRGEKASWKAGYNFGLGNWHGWTFQVILNGGAVRVQSSTVTHPGIDEYDANDKQFVGCIGGLTVHGGVTTASIDDEDVDSTQPDACERRRRMSQSMEEKWGVDDPSFGYEDNTFELDFEISDLISSVDQNKPEWFYDDCTTPYAGVALTPSKAENFTTAGADKQIIGVYMKVDPETIESETDVFTLQQQASGQRMATIELCMRFVLNTPPLTANPNDFMEVNFLEVTTTLKVDLTDGFEIDESFGHQEERIRRSCRRQGSIHSKVLYTKAAVLLNFFVGENARMGGITHLGFQKKRRQTKLQKVLHTVRHQ